jgi:hypothetical protein
MTRVVLPILALLLLTGGLTAALSQHPWSPRRDVVQPIPFSHRVHAGENQIPCQYCHEYARRSQTAGVPPVQRCVGCHAQAGWNGTLEAVTQPWSDTRQPPFEIVWNRVYTLPDFVRFTHRPHVLAGVSCQTCHGPVETMDRVVPVKNINMGFCISCHAQRRVETDCSLCHY